MKKISQSTSSEIIFGSSDSAISQSIRRAVKARKLRKLAPKLYTSNFKDSDADIIKRHIWLILSTFFPNAVISHRSALMGGVSSDNVIILTYKYNKNVFFPGITIRLLKGYGPQHSDTRFLKDLYFSSRPRALLENLQTSRQREALIKTLSREQIEAMLDKYCRVYGPEELNSIRDEARILSKKLKFSKEFKILEKLISSLLGTSKYPSLKTKAARLRAKGLPYDSERISLFSTLAAYLKSDTLALIKAPIKDPKKIRYLAFFEAYFSNYIEGTEFDVSEAKDIVFYHKPFPQRPLDAHDILGTFQIVSNTEEMSRTPKTPSMLIELLQHRHLILMEGRKDKQPGKFKLENNRAGNTVFVSPELVRGTLHQAFELYKNLEKGLARAMFSMFVVSEIHPFVDGNGRIARVMMNAELVHMKQCRIIIPTAYREDYLLALRRLSRSQDPGPYIRMLARAQAFTASIDFSTYERALKQLKAANAFAKPHEAKLKF